MITQNQLGFIVLVVIVIIIASNQTYFNNFNRAYKYFSKIPGRLIFIFALLTGLAAKLGILPASQFKDLLPTDNILYKPQQTDTSTKNKRAVSESTKKLIAAKQQWRCALCGRLLDETYEVDHIIPLYKGGTNDPSNLMALDPICHRKKTNADRLGIPYKDYTSILQD